MDVKLLFLFVSSVTLVVTSTGVVSPAKTSDVAAANKNRETAVVIDGVDVTKLSDEKLDKFMDAEDEILMGDLDIRGYVNGVSGKPRRPKRWISIAARALFTAGRALFRGSSRGRVTRSGSRLTRQYNKPGNYGDAVRDFRRLNPGGVKPLNSNKLQGMTGTVGKHRVTVRSSSSNGRPTLEVRSPKTNGQTVRKFRYNQK